MAASPRPTHPSANVPLPGDPAALLGVGLPSQASAGGESTIEAAPGSPGAGSPGSAFVPPSVAELRRLFSQFEVLELLGHGGMGAVYKARQIGLDRLVAVKILPPHLGHAPGFAERFTREARALARLNHPNIVHVHDFGRVATGGGELFYITMEYIDGTNLRQMLRTQRIPPAEALAIVGQVCEALQFAHDEGIVHRDIKPENILIDRKGRVKIADFGLAKLADPAAADLSLTATGGVMGTPKYMAPEQIEGARDVDHRADIYSLGVVFYELLTGELPLGRFAAPSQRVQVDVRLDDIVLKALEKLPQQRYQQASQVKTEVEAVRLAPGGDEAAEAARRRSAVAASAAGRSRDRAPDERDTAGFVCAIIALAVFVLGLIVPSILVLTLPGRNQMAAASVAFLVSMAVAFVLGLIGRRHRMGRWTAFFSFLLGVGLPSLVWVSRVESEPGRNAPDPIITESGPAGRSARVPGDTEPGVVRREENMAEPLVQAGEVDLKRGLGEYEIYYPRPYAGEPELIFPVKEWVEFRDLKQTPRGFTLYVHNLSRPQDGKSALRWRAAGTRATKTTEEDLVVHSGSVPLRDLGEVEVFYPKRYAATPNLVFTEAKWVDFENVRQGPAGFKLYIKSLSHPADEKPVLQWKAVGEPPSQEPPSVPESPEAAWVRQFAQQYLAVLEGDGVVMQASKEAVAMYTPAYARRIEQGDHLTSYRSPDWKLAEVRLSPDANEALVVATGQANKQYGYAPGSGGGEEPSFKGALVRVLLRVVKQADTSTWKIDHVQFDELPADPQAAASTSRPVQVVPAPAQAADTPAGAWARAVASAYLNRVGMRIGGLVDDDALHWCTNDFARLLDDGFSGESFSFDTWRIAEVILNPESSQAVVTGSLSLTGRVTHFSAGWGEDTTWKGKRGEGTYSMRLERVGGTDPRWRVASMQVKVISGPLSRQDLR